MHSKDSSGCPRRSALFDWLYTEKWMFAHATLYACRSVNADVAIHSRYLGESFVVHINGLPTRVMPFSSRARREPPQDHETAC